jgi:predicted AAA+ superfamily ATPase
VFIERTARQRLSELMGYFPVTVVTGPRQSGKTTLLKAMLPDWEYVNLESSSDRQLAEADPAGFLQAHSDHVILDEVQRVPDLLSDLQAAVDEDRRPGRFALSGSQNLLMGQAVSQSLAGRAAYVQLPPLTLPELAAAGLGAGPADQLIFAGAYPGVWADGIPPAAFFDQYIATYVERDLRQVKNITDLTLFRRFMGLLAGRIGQLVDYASIADDVGVSPKTVRAWLSVLEASYLVFTVPPYSVNVGKRLIKSAKVYFADTGLACRLLGITEAGQLASHYARGALFENLVIGELRKRVDLAALDAQLFFLRDAKGHEADLVVSHADGRLTLVEIKSSQTFSRSFTKGLDYWRAIWAERADASAPNVTGSFVVYGGRAGQVGDTELIGLDGLDQVLR